MSAVVAELLDYVANRRPNVCVGPDMRAAIGYRDAEIAKLRAVEMITTPEIEISRAWKCVDWIVRVLAPAECVQPWMKNPDIREANILRAIPEINNAEALAIAYRESLRAYDKDRKPRYCYWCVDDAISNAIWACKHWRDHADPLLAGQDAGKAFYQRLCGDGACDLAPWAELHSFIAELAAIQAA